MDKGKVNRVISLGEVYTPQNYVENILDLIPETHYSSRIFEPGCGSGNFLLEILNRKLQNYSKSKKIKNGLLNENVKLIEYELIVLVSSIYSVEIDKDNINTTRKKLTEAISKYYEKILKTKISEDFKQIVNFVISSNIIQGDLLNEIDKIIVYEFSELPDYKFNVRKFIFSELLFPDNEVFEVENKLFGHIPEPIDVVENISYSNLHKEIG